MILVRRTEFNDFMPEQSLDILYRQDAENFEAEMAARHCYYDGEFDAYYAPDDSMCWTVLEWF